MNRPLLCLLSYRLYRCHPLLCPDNGMVKKMAGYVVLGVNSEGMKEILTIEVGENE